MAFDFINISSYELRQELFYDTDIASRIDKTVWVSCKDYLFEALPRFLTEYFELNLSPERYRGDAEWFYDIEDDLKFLSGSWRHCWMKRNR